jgi:hypothetical protein
VVTSRGKHILHHEHPLLTPLVYAGAYLCNAITRKAMGAWLERVVFSSCGELPFDTSDFATQHMTLNEGNFMAALQASCSIPFVLQAVHDIPDAPTGAYWDGGITDYHLHLNYKGLVLYPHFQQAVVPGWLDKALKWRHKSTPFLDNTIVLAPNPEWVKTLPNGKLPDRVIDISDVQPGKSIYGIIGTQWLASVGKVSAATGFKDTCVANPGPSKSYQPCSGASASFPLPLPKRLALTNFGIAGGAFEDPECNGTFEKPTAPAGHLCIYPGKEPGYYNAKEAEIVNIARNGEGNWDATAYLMTGLAGKLGFRIDIKAYNSGYAKFYASYAYTAAKGSDSAS